MGRRARSCAAAAALLVLSQVAAQEDIALLAAVPAAQAAEGVADTAGPAADLELSEDVILPDNWELPEDFQPMAVFEEPSEDEAAVAADGADVEEITVIGVRRRRTVVDVQQEIKLKTEQFFDEYNELVLDDAYKIKCAWFNRRRMCAAGYMIKELKDRAFFGQVGVYRRPPQEYFDARGQMYTRTVIEALRERPSLIVLAEEINALREEEVKLSGRTRMLERKAERERRRELLGPAILRAARNPPGRQRP